MVKFLTAGKVVLILNGRYAGKKAVIVKNFDDGSKERPYGHALVVGIEKAPLAITKSMGQKRIAKRSKVKPFVKIVNYNHIMPTRYNFALDGELKESVSVEKLKDASQRKTSKKSIKKALEEKYRAGKNIWFFQKLRF